MITHVRRETFRTAEELLYAGRLQRRNPLHGFEQHRFHVLKIAGDFVEAEIIRNAFHTPGPRIGLKRAHHQFARVIFVIGTGIVIPQHRHVGMQTIDGFEQQVIMLAGV